MFLLPDLFFLIFSFARRFNDDIWPGNLYENGNVLQYWQHSLNAYTTWSSRLFVNFIWLILMYSLSKLFVKQNKKECNFMIACLVMLFPFQYMSEAGWIATMTTYLSPTAFGFLSLIPIKKFLDNEKFSWWEYILYTVALIYGANIEQMMVVILGAYVVAAIYFLTVRQFHFYWIIQFLLSIVSCLNTLWCPGNHFRILANNAVAAVGVTYIYYFYMLFVYFYSLEKIQNCSSFINGWNTGVANDFFRTIKRNHSHDVSEYSWTF